MDHYVAKIEAILRQLDRGTTPPALQELFTEAENLDSEVHFRFLRDELRAMYKLFDQVYDMLSRHRAHPETFDSQAQEAGKKCDEVQAHIYYFLMYLRDFNRESGDDGTVVELDALLETKFKQDTDHMFQHWMGKRFDQALALCDSFRKIEQDPTPKSLFAQLLQLHRVIETILHEIEKIMKGLDQKEPIADPQKSALVTQFNALLATHTRYTQLIRNFILALLRSL